MNIESKYYYKKKKVFNLKLEIINTLFNYFLFIYYVYTKKKKNSL